MLVLVHLDTQQSDKCSVPSAGIAASTAAVQTAVSVRGWIFNSCANKTHRYPRTRAWSWSDKRTPRPDAGQEEKTLRHSCCLPIQHGQREKHQTSLYLSFWGKLTPKMSNFQPPSMALQWSGAANLVHRQRNNGTPLPFCVPSIWNSTHLSISSIECGP